MEGIINKMFEIKCLDLITNKIFYKIFWSIKKKNDFIRKCKYSKKIKVIEILDYSNIYD